MKGETSEIFIESDKLNCCLTDKAKPKFFHAVLYAKISSFLEASLYSETIRITRKVNVSIY